jgi:hypothetical protein
MTQSRVPQGMVAFKIILGLCCLSVPAQLVSAQIAASPSTIASFPHWNKSQEITISGVLGEKSVAHSAGVPAGLHYQVQSAQGPVDASFGPFLSHDVASSLASGESVELVGLMENIHGTNTLLVRQATIGGRQVTIRNQQGLPVRTHATPLSSPSSSQALVNGGTR